MTTVLDNSPSEASSESRPRTGQMQFLTPTPSGFEPEYDYIATLKALAEAAGLDTAAWSRLYEETCVPTSGPPPTVCIIDSTGSTDCLVRPRNGLHTKKQTVAWVYIVIQTIRQMMRTEAQQRTRVLLAETHRPLVLQVLCAAFDLDPAFLLRHIRKPLGVKISESGIATLSRAFATCVADSRNGNDDLEDTRATWHIGRTDQPDSFHVHGETSYAQQVDNQAGSPVKPRSSSSRISCCRISTFDCE
jgi:hypothetical protein